MRIIERLLIFMAAIALPCLQVKKIRYFTDADEYSDHISNAHHVARITQGEPV
jgi:hypothetical protein